MKRVAAILLLMIVFAGFVYAQEDDPADLRPSRTRWLLQFDDDIRPEAIRDIARSFDAEAVDLGPYSSFWLFRFSEALSDEAVAELLDLSNLVFAEREARFRTTLHAMALDPDDPLHQRQWAHRMINLGTAHELNFGADPSVTVAVLDSGVAYLDTANRAMAPDLAGTIIQNGYDFVSEDMLALDEGDGVLGHGTFLAGVVAQTTYNARGTAGIAFNAALLPVRVVNRRGVARAGDLARGIRYSVINGASVILLGVAGPTDSRAVREAIEFAWENNVAVIAPAGNSEKVLFPARYEEVLSVGAVDAGGRRAYYSPEDGPVDIYAPGGDLREGVDADGDGYPDGILAESFLDRKFDAFQPVMMEGTSAAAAHVAGVAALLLSMDGPLTPERLYNALLRGANGEGGYLTLDAGKTLIRALNVGK